MSTTPTITGLPPQLVTTPRLGAGLRNREGAGENSKDSGSSGYSDNNGKMMRDDNVYIGSSTSHDDWEWKELRPQIDEELFFKEHKRAERTTERGLWWSLKETFRLPKDPEEWETFKQKRFPIAHWLPRYKKEYLIPDIVGGLTMAVVIIPQGIAYAALAGVPTQYGLYSCVFPPLVYFFFGTCAQMSTGVFSLVSLMTGVEGNKIVGAGQSQQVYIDTVVLLTFYIGLILTIMGIFKFGFVTMFLSDPTISGFTTGAAVLILVSQLRPLFGVPIPNYQDPFAAPQSIVFLFKHIAETNVADMILGFCAIIALLILREVNLKLKRYTKIPIPSEFLVVLVSTLIVWLADLKSKYGVATVGNIPKGLPAPSLPNISVQPIGTMLSSAFQIGIVGFLNSVSLAKVLSEKHGYKSSSNQELLVLGYQNLIGGFFSCQPASGALARSTLASAMGVQTQISSLITTGVVVTVLLFLTTSFRFIPKSVLAAMIMVALRGLFMQVHDARKLRHQSTSDFFVWVWTFVCTVLLGVTYGLISGVAMAMMVFVYKTSRPNTSSLGWVQGTDVYRDLRRIADLEKIERCVIFRFNSSMFYANARYFQKQLGAAIQERARDEGCPPTTVILDMSNCTMLDVQAVAQMRKVAKDLKKKQIELLLAGCTATVRDKLAKGGFHQEIPLNHLFLTVHDAVIFHKRGGKSVGSMGPTEMVPADGLGEDLADASKCVLEVTPESSANLNAGSGSDYAKKV